MKKKTKKLVLSRETVRGLTVDLGRVGGANDDSMFSCIMRSCVVSDCYVCDAPETVHPPCTA